MTPDELRELDRQVAVEVMGWRRQGVDYWPGWHPTSSWQDAGRVLEKLAELGFRPHVFKFTATGWAVEIFLPEPETEATKFKPYPCWRASEKTAPLAICLAALQAVRGGGSEARNQEE